MRDDAFCFNNTVARPENKNNSALTGFLPQFQGGLCCLLFPSLLGFPANT